MGTSNKRNNQTRLRYLLFFLVGILLYALLAFLFHYLAGQSLYFRDSRNNIKMPPSSSGAVEITRESSVAQTFVSDIPVLRGFEIQWGTYNRESSSHIYVALYDETEGTRLLYQRVDTSKLKEGEKVKFLLDEPSFFSLGHLLNIRITTDDGEVGNSATPLISEKTIENGNLYFNEQTVSGMLCFSTIGQDYVSIGTYYWHLVCAVGVVWAVFILILLYRKSKGKTSIILIPFIAVQKYRFLLQQLVSRDFKTKYKRSILGVLWSFLNPLLLMLVQYFVFSNLFQANIENYHIYLLIGVVIFNFFNEACGTILTSITSNASLITKVYIPKYIYPISKMLSATINFLISLIPLLVLIFLTPLSVTKAYFLLPFPLLCIFFFCLGFGMILASGMVFFRDIQFLWGILSTMWMYGTPIFYDINIIPEQYRIIIYCNPLYYFIDFFRTCIMMGTSPDPFLYIKCGLFALGMLFLGMFVFKKTQNRFVLYL